MTRPSRAELAILRTVVYASVFDYPLTLAQLHQTLLESSQTEVEILSHYRASVWLQDAIDYRDGLFFLRGQDDLIAERRRRETRTHDFLQSHERLLQLICAVPFTRLVALSGSVAHFNMDRRGDLDLFIVTRGSRVWSVTVTLLLLAKLARRRDALCVNFVISDRRLRLEQDDLFTANQIISLRPVAGAGMFREFVAANRFVARYYANFSADCVRDLWGPRRHGSIKRAVEIVLSCGPAQFFERVCRAAYGWYLRGKSARWPSPEQVRLEADCLKLHTHSHRRRVIDRFVAALADVEARRSASTDATLAAP